MKCRLPNLPAGIPAKDLIRLAKSRRRIGHDYRELRTALGPDHFEDRSFATWTGTCPTCRPPAPWQPYDTIP
ncbi:hypothetical protein OTB16_12355 [Streptomyces sp. H27-S2]|nr:hypothetical protein [Streptomyces sp. H27-S2]MCY0950292.1 hypothetical protein [Streptomyces sp. H27-S2]